MNTHTEAGVFSDRDTHFNLVSQRVTERTQFNRRFVTRISVVYSIFTAEIFISKKPENVFFLFCIHFIINIFESKKQIIITIIVIC